MKAVCYLSLSLFTLFVVSSCKKDVTTTKSKKDLITSATWVYDEYFANYDQTSTMLVYKRGKPNNAMDLSLNKVKYNADGTYQETTETGSTLNGTWQLLNGETQTQVKNASGTYTSTIISLSETGYIWYDQSADRYAKMIPQ